MQSYRRVLAVVDLDRSSREVARTAFGVARDNQARFAIGHIADWGQDLGADDFCLYTPQELEERLAAVVRRQLRALADGLGARDAASLVTVAAPGRGLAEMVRGWQPDLVVAASGSRWIVADNVPGWACEVMAVPAATAGFLSRTAKLARQAIAPVRLAHRGR